MRILQLIAQSKLGGAESAGFALAAGFAERGHKTLLLSNRRNGPLLERPRPPAMSVADLPRASRLDPRILPFLFGHVASFRPDVIHAHNYEASVWARFLGLWHPRIAVVVHVHSSRFVQRHGRHRILTDRVLFRRADAVITLNDAQESFLREKIRVPAAKLHRVPNGIDTDSFAAPPGTGPGEAAGSREAAGLAGATGSGGDGGARRDARGPHSTVCVASLTDVKNHAGLLRAWASVVRSLPDAHLTLVGDGELRTALEEQVDSLALSGRVTFAGLQEDVRPFLWRASVFVLASHSEALPLSLLEAMAAGCAPVATAVGGIVDVIEDGVTGYLVPPRDDDALARRLLGALSDEPGRSAMAERAREAVARRFGQGVWLDRIEEIYRETLNRRGRRARG